MIGDVVDGSGQQVVVVDDVWCGEDYVQLHGSAGEGVVGVAGQHVDALLFCCDNAFVALRYVAEDAEVDQCSACLVVAMHGKDVAASLEQTSLLAVQTNHDTVHVVHDASGSLLAIDVDVAGIVVREDEVEVALQLFVGEVDCATYPDVVVFLRPWGTDVVVVVRAEGTFAALPVGVVEVGLHPVLSGL